MTIEDLIGMSADQLEAMTNQQCLEYFGDKLAITRPTPELRLANAGKASTKRSTNPDQYSLGLSDEKLKRAREIAAAAGLDLDESGLE